MSDPLLSEDTDLARLVAGIRAEHGDAAKVIYHDTVRRGGVLGFFAREVHRVTYRVEDALVAAGVGHSAVDLVQDVRTEAEQTHADPIEPTDALADPIEALLAEADATEANAAESDAADGDPASTDWTALPQLRQQAQRSADFASALHAALIEAGQTVVPDPEPVSSDWTPSPSHEQLGEHALVEPAKVVDAESVLQQVLAQPVLASVTQLPGRVARARLELLLQLREIGVPVGINPGNDAHSIYEAMEEILADLPPAPELPHGAGEIIGVVGELTPALRAASALAGQLRLDASAVWIAGLHGHPVVSSVPAGADQPRPNLINGPAEAAAVREQLRRCATPTIVVVATDAVEGEPDDPWAGQVLNALNPTVSLLMVDATRKADDAHAALARLGGVDAIAVHSARLSSSPASTWDLGLPIALVDGRPANTFVWSSLLLSAIRSRPRQQTPGSTDVVSL